MSRIGVKPISLPSDVTVTMSATQIEVKGPKGSLSQPALKGIKVEQSDNQLLVTRTNNGRQTRAFHGLMRSVLSNLVQGVTQGYQKKLELVGTGYRAKKQGDNITLSVGYSHPVEYIAPEGIILNTEGDTVISVSGINKQLVGEVAAKIRAVRKPEPYKGKGIRYQGEVIRRKAGKATKVGSS
jgi:large subunit ribosomal protein L6